MFNQMSSKQKYKYKKYSKYKKMFYVYEQKQLWWNLILKQNQSTDKKRFWVWLQKLSVGTFIRNFKLASMILTLPLNKKPSSAVPL